MEVILLALVVFLLVAAAIAAGQRNAGSSKRVRDFSHEHATELARLIPGLVGPTADGDFEAPFGAHPAIWRFELSPGIGLIVNIDLTAWNLPIRIASTRLTDTADLLLAPIHDWPLDIIERLEPIVHDLEANGVQFLSFVRVGDPHIMQIVAPSIATFAERLPQLVTDVQRLDDALRLAPDQPSST